MMEKSEVKDAVDKSRLSIGVCFDFLIGPSDCVYYDDVPLWRTVAPLEDLDIYLYDPTPYRNRGEDSEPYSLVCVDPFGDIYTYGSWSTLEEAKDWLANPIPLY